MNAIEMLERQHRDLERLFERFEAAPEGSEAKERVFRELADALAIHSEIEERIFYPECKTPETEAMLRESVEEHLSVKRLVSDLLEDGAGDEQFEAKIHVLREQVDHHVEEEEEELFPRVRRTVSREDLEDMGERMRQLVDDLEAEGEPALNLPAETDRPAQL